jgi:hypothetical protein
VHRFAQQPEQLNVAFPESYNFRVFLKFGHRYQCVIYAPAAVMKNTLLALGCSSRFAVKEMNLLAQASELLLLLQKSNLIRGRPGCGVPKLVSSTNFWNSSVIHNLSPVTLSQSAAGGT